VSQIDWDETELEEVEEFDDEVEYLDIVRFNLFGFIDQEVACAFIQAMYEQDTSDTGAVWEVVLNTEGGDMEAGTAIYSELLSYSEQGGGSHYVITRVRGQAASCGSLILQAGDLRTAGRMDYVMMHEPNLTFSDAPLHQVRIELEQADSWTHNFINILAERSEMSYEFFAESMSGRDWWLDSNEALDVGIIDEVS
jgi:ATP-dependent Clp protease protease subunit